jgi:hypothetical protein
MRTIKSHKLQEPNESHAGALDVKKNIIIILIIVALPKS